MHATRMGFGILTTVVLLAGPAQASNPQWVRLSFAQADATTSIGISWHTDSASDPNQIEYGISPSMDLAATGTATQGPGPLMTIHEAVLTGLVPGTVYRYRVGGPGAWSQEFTFQTPPADICTPYTFGVLGDNRSDNDDGPSPRWFPIISELIQSNPLFILNSGDIVRDGSKPEQWANWLEASDQTLAITPHLPTLGNHDDGPEEGDPAHYNRLFNLPRNDDTNTEDYYYFTTGNAIIVSLSTQTFKDFPRQAAWLDRVLTDNPRMWRFVFFHHPIFTSSSVLGLLDISHAPNEQGQNRPLTAVFDKHHVDFVFYGHNHFYERFQPMTGDGDEDEGTPVGDPEKGTQYVVTGGAGALAYNIAIALFCGSAKGSSKCSGNHHFLRIELAGDQLTFTAHATAQQLLGSNPNNSKDIETFSYRKPWPDGNNPCAIPPLPDPLPEQGEPVPEAGPDQIPEAAAGDVATPEPPIEAVPDVPVTPTDIPGPPPDAPDVPIAPIDVPMPPPDTTDVPPSPRDEAATQDTGTTPPADATAPATDVPSGTPGQKGGGCSNGTSPASFLPMALLLLAFARTTRRRRR